MLSDSDSVLPSRFARATPSCISAPFYSFYSVASNTLEQCVFDPTACALGLSAAVWVRFNAGYLANGGARQTLLSTGSQSGLAPGFSLYQQVSLVPL